MMAFMAFQPVLVRDFEYALVDVIDKYPSFAGISALLSAGGSDLGATVRVTDVACPASLSLGEAVPAMAKPTVTAMVAGIFFMGFSSMSFGYKGPGCRNDLGLLSSAFSLVCEG